MIPTTMLSLDRVLFTATYYPMNYGFIPRTYVDDHDPLDVTLLCSQPIQPMTIVRSYPIGVMYMEDSGMGDEKIIAVTHFFRDSSFFLFLLFFYIAIF